MRVSIVNDLKGVDEGVSPEFHSSLFGGAEDQDRGSEPLLVPGLFLPVTCSNFL